MKIGQQWQLSKPYLYEYILLRFLEKDDNATDFDIHLIHTIIVYPTPFSSLPPSPLTQPYPELKEKRKKKNTSSEDQLARSRALTTIPSTTTRWSTNMGRLDPSLVSPSVIERLFLHPNPLTVENRCCYFLFFIVNRMILVLFIVDCVFDISAGTA
jgi:hypothetical protein